MSRVLYSGFPPPNSPSILPLPPESPPPPPPHLRRMTEAWRHNDDERRRRQAGCYAGTEQHRQSIEIDAKDSVIARKVLKADREKLRRDRLNEMFVELGKTLDPHRPKNDKATILMDTIQMLKDMTSQVGRLKEEYASLSDESHELTQEKNELREEKNVLKSDIDNLHAQHQHRLRTMFPWTAMDPSNLMLTSSSPPPPPYPYVIPMTIPPGPIPVHPYPFFPSVVPNPCPAFVSSPCNTRVEAPLTACIPSPNPQSSNNRSQMLCLNDSRRKDSVSQKDNCVKAENFSNVATELELKIPGSTIPSCSGSTHNQESCSKERNKQPWPSQKKRGNFEDASSSSRCSSSHGLHNCSSQSCGDGSVAEN